MRIFIIIAGIILAAVGGVTAYRAFFLEPSTAVVISESGVRELPDYFKVATGLALLVIGAMLAVGAATRRRQR